MSSSSRDSQSRPPGRRVPRIGLVVLGLIVSLLPVTAEHCFRVPLTASAPAGLYLLDYRPLRRGSWVVVCLPEEVGTYGRRRGYLGAGRCPGEASEVLKRVGALPGDRVEVTEGGLVVDGRPVPGTRRRRSDSRGRPIARIPVGSYTVAPGRVWLLSTHSPRSWDSRYYGPVPLSGVRSSARRLLATPGNAE